VHLMKHRPSVKSQGLFKDPYKEATSLKHVHKNLMSPEKRQRAI